MNFNEYVYYDESSPTSLRWAIDVKCGKGRVQYRANEPAGSQKRRPNGKPHRIVVRINRKDYSVHRIIWILFFGEIPNGMLIDHVDRNPWNNLLSNLECKTYSGNQQNKSKQRNNSTGVTGVRCYYNSDKTLLGYQSTWNEDGKTKTKSFSFFRYGAEAFEQAVQFRKNKLKKLNDTGENYTATHGE